MNALLAPVLAAAIVTQTAAPLRFGPTAADLTQDDFDQIRDLTKTRGRVRAVWGRGASGPAGPEGVSWGVTVFVDVGEPPARVRRGLLLYATTRLSMPVRYDGAKTWTLSSAESAWAQVADGDRPFAVSGSIDDDTLLRVVALIRTNPVPAERATSPWVARVQGAWPVIGMTRQDETTLEVHLAKPDSSELSGQNIVLQRADGGWIVRSIGLWVA